MSDLIIDASIAIKWVSVEEGTPEAVKLRRHAVAAPELLLAECANILWKKIRRSELTAEEAGFAARLLADADIELMPMRRHFERAIEIATEIDHPAYDCLYLALAEAEGLPFVTADDRLMRKLGQPASARYRDRVVRLTDAAAL